MPAADSGYRGVRPAFHAKAEFYRVIREAVADFVAHGFDSETRLTEWLRRIERSAAMSLISPDRLRSEVARTLMNVYSQQVEKGAVLKRNPGVQRFTVDKLKPRLRQELDRRIAASANLIKLNRDKAVQTTLSRFSGWATSLPAGGADTVARAEEGKKLRKALAQLPFEERRVAIDQGHKLVSSINEIVAVDAGAIAAVWHSKWRQPGYDYREDHKERDQLVYMVPDNWALQKHLVKPVHGFINDITRPGEEPFCRCNYVYLYTLRQLPEDMLTARGKMALSETRARLAA